MIGRIGAGIRRLDPTTGSRIITLGFGFEAVNRPSSRPSFLDRPGLLRTFLSWFAIPTGVGEPAPSRLPVVAIRAAPNPFRDELRLEAELPPGTRLLVRDAVGRVVATLRLGEKPSTPTARMKPTRETAWVAWDARTLPAGVYFISPAGSAARAVRVVRID